MKIKFNIQQKIQFYIITTSILIYILAIGYISFTSRKMAYNDAIEKTDLQVLEASLEMSNDFASDMTIVETLSQSFLSYNDLEEDAWMQLVESMYRDVFMNNPHVYSLWDSWELSALDTIWDKPYGRIAHTFWRENGVIKNDWEYRSLDGDPELYAIIKKRTIPSIWEPYFDVYTANKAEKYLMTSVNSPMIVNGQYVGIVAFDITLDRFQQRVEEIKPIEGSYAFMISNGGIISGHPNKEMLNKNMDDIFPDDTKEQKILKNIQLGESFSYVSYSEDGTKMYYSYAPIEIKSTNTPWSLAIAVPVKVIMKEANRNFLISLIVGVVGILVMAIIIFYIGRNISNPITSVTSLLKRIAKGHIDEKMHLDIKTGDEIEEMSEALNTSISGLLGKQEFAEDIGKGELESDIELLSEEDSLGKSLVDMRDSLIKAREEEEKRKIEDEKRKWSNEGLAKFADILRQNNNDMDILGSEIIQNLVNYLEANQGGIFIMNSDDEDDIHIELLSAFAYDRRKFLTKKISVGEGLIGTCVQEKKSIYMTDIPQDYIEITSGLGGANPSSLLIVPLKLEDEILGAIEIASFEVFETHEIEFVEKVAESIASTLNSVRINIRTSQLLERSQQQAEEMAAQEEEMRQNMEELQATQEESARKSVEMEGLIEALNTSSYVVEYDLNGDITDANDNYVNLLGIGREEIIGTHHSGSMDFTEDQKSDYDKFWADLRSGRVRKEITKVAIKGRQYRFSETYTPIRNTDGEVYKILKISNNITDYHENS